MSGSASPAEATSAEGLSVDLEHEAGGFRLAASFTAGAGVTALFGPSGSGKTTLVNAVAGLVRPQRGRIVLDGTTLLETENRIVVPPHRRRIGYVFQEARLFPHLSVRRNLGFGRLFAPRGAPKPDTRRIVELLGIGHLLDRGPASLSGGEKQRVAIGRALLSSPRLLLMDEPLASLDERRKAEILPYLEGLRDGAGVPILYVSHAVGEVARLASTLVLLEGGRTVASGPAEAMLARLDLPALSGTREAGAALTGRIASHDDGFGLTCVDTPAGPLTVPRLPGPVGTALRLQVRARDVMIATERPSGLSALNVLPATIAEIAPGPDAAADVRLRCGEGEGGAVMLARLTRRSVSELGLAPGRAVFAVVKTVSFEGVGSG